MTKPNLKSMIAVLRHVGMGDEDIETLADQVPNGEWRIRPSGDSRVFVVSVENKDACAWMYLEPSCAQPLSVNDDFYQWVKRSGI